MRTGKSINTWVLEMNVLLNLKKILMISIHFSVESINSLTSYPSLPFSKTPSFVHMVE